MDTFQLICGSVCILCTCLVTYMAFASRPGRLSNILMALGVTSETLFVFAASKPVRVTASLLAFVLITISLVMSLRLFRSSQRRQH